MRMTKCHESPERLSQVKEEDSAERQKEEPLAFGLIKCGLSDEKSPEALRKFESEHSTPNSVASEGDDKG